MRFANTRPQPGRNCESVAVSNRGIGFEEIVFHIERGDPLDIVEHPNPGVTSASASSSSSARTTATRVPFVEAEHTVFLKTIIPSRKATKEYLGEQNDDEA
jgi:hypothetical protein